MYNMDSKPARARDCDAKQFIRYIVTNEKTVEKRRVRRKALGKRTAHQKIPRIGDECNDSDLQIACVGGNQCKGSVFSGGSIVEKTGEKALKRTKTCLTRCNAERKRDRKIAKPDRNAIADSVDQNLAGK